VVQEDGHRTRPTLDPDERQRVQRANQIFLRLRKELSDREQRITEKDVRDAAQGALWLREVVDRCSDDLEQAYEDALAASGLPKDDQAYLWRETEEAGGFASFVRHHLRNLEKTAPAESEHAGDPAEGIAPQDLARGTVAGLIAGGTMMGNSFYFGFAVGTSRRAECW
jgi:hypothetical protein